MVEVVNKGEQSSEWQVMGSGMEPSFPDGTLVDAVEYGSREPQRGDVVVFALDLPERYFMKRIIGMPGDKVEIRSGVVYINDEPIEESYIQGATVCPCGPWQIEEGHYFVLGDNRPNSSDSRQLGPIAEGSILGRVEGDVHRPIILGPIASPAAPTATPPPFLHPNLESLEQATVVEVIDGDTIHVLIDGERQPVRYYGIDAPEQGEKCYQEATDRNRELVGRIVRLEADARDKDEYGRLLRYVFTNDGISVDAALVNEGLATAWREDGRYVNRLTVYEGHAQQEGIGCLWK